MPRLLLKFESQLLAEIPIGSRPLTIGRAPDSDIRIDNLAVSDHHARISTEGDRLLVEDLLSLNGTYVNDVRVDRVMLRDGDTIRIGKHQLQLDVKNDAAAPSPAGSGAEQRRSPAPRIDETSVLDTAHQRQLLRQTAARSTTGAATGTAAPAGGPGQSPEPREERLRRATLLVLRGRTDRREYTLAGKLTVIGRSELASVRLLGWFAPSVAAQINRRQDGYYLGLGDRVPKINGQLIHAPTLLRDGDIIQIGRVKLQFSNRD